MLSTMTPLSSADARARLKGAGLRSTGPRVAALTLLGAGGHWSATEVFESVRTELPGTSLQAMYGVLTALHEAKILRKIDPSGGAALYEMYVGDNHHHLVCIECGEIHDVPCAVGAAPCLTASDSHDYEILAADVTFRGICASCRSREAEA